MFSDEELTALYPPDYYAYRDEVKATLWKERAKRALGYWQGTKDPHFDRPGRFLDIGCGSGTFVQRMRDAGWSSYGVEVSEPAAQLAQSRNLQVFWGRLQDARFPSESFDYIRASHSLEHMTSPHESIDEIHRLLKPGGRVLIAIPNIESLSARIFREHWYHLCPPVHAFNYSVKTLGRMLSIHGFRHMVFV
jgi:SAM-dependent methyltransferase